MNIRNDSKVTTGIKSNLSELSLLAQKINMEEAHFEHLISTLSASSPSPSVQDRLSCALELRESLPEINASNTRLLSHLVQSCISVLEGSPLSTQPAFSSDSPVHRLRNTVLEIIQRLPFTDGLRNHAPQLLGTVMNCLREDNEENAAICLRVIIELHKNYRGTGSTASTGNGNGLEEFVQPFFDYFKVMLQQMQANVQHLIDNGGDIEMSSSSSESDGSGDNDPLFSGGGEGGRAYLKSINSFKVLSECPIILVLLFQIYKKFINANIPDLVPLIAQVIQIRVSVQRQYGDVGRSGFTPGPDPGIVNKALYSEFIGAQVKIMSFLAYIIRGFSHLLKPHQQAIADSIIHLLIDCPQEASSIRKELLVAARHILSTDFRSSFVPYIDLLFREDVMVGTGLTSRETLRPLGYSMLADLVHHIRQELTAEQINRTISLYTKNLHDPSLSPSIQTMCSKLLLNLIDCIVAYPNKDESKRLLMRILQAFASKFELLKSVTLKLTAKLRHVDPSKYAEVMESVDLQTVVDVEHLALIKSSLVAGDHQNMEIIKDYKFLFKTLVLGLKTIIYGLKTVTTATGPSGQPVYKKLVEEEVELFVDLFRDGLDCFRIFQLDTLITADQQSTESARAPAIAKEEKEILDHFVTVFTLIDPAVFHEVFQSQIHFFFERFAEDSTMLSVPQFLLASEVVSRNFSSILLDFLMKNLKDLGGEDTTKSTLLLRLFKLVFMAVTLYPEVNESVLQPHIYDLIMKALKFSASAKESNTYFLLLRALFRNIGGGRFELLYKEVLPLLPFLLKTLNNLLHVAEKAHMRDLFVELCLTVPVRLSVLLPHLHYLMQPLVLSLEAGSDLVSQGLRTLELCIDNLTAEFLDPIIAPVFDKLMFALWKHLKPASGSQTHSHATLRILGKLGGRNRKMLKESSQLNYALEDLPRLQVMLPFEAGKAPVGISLYHCLKSVELAFGSNSAAAVSESGIVAAFDFLKSSLSLFVDVGVINADNVRHIQNFPQQIQLSQEVLNSIGQQQFSGKSNFATEQRRKDGHTSLVRILSLLIPCCNYEKVSDDALQLCRQIATYFALVCAVEKTVESYNLEDCVLTHKTYLNAIEISLTENNSKTRSTAQEMLKLFKEALFIVSPNLEPFKYLSKKLCSACYKPDWFRKLGAVEGVGFMFKELDLGAEWALHHHTEFVKSFLFSLKDTSYEVAPSEIDIIYETLVECLRYTFKENSKTDANANSAQIMTILVSEISNPNSSVRSLVQKALSVVADLLQCQVTEVLLPYKDRLFGPIFSKPLRALPFNMQIGNLDSLTFTLSLDGDLLQLNDELVRLIQEARSIADADDSSLTSRSSQLKNAELLVELRTSCVNFLSIAQSLPEMTNNPDLTQLRKEIAHLFFKCMYSKSASVVEAAKKGLRQAVVQQKIPKELLQTGLRPILMNLSEWKRLTVEGLNGLGRLLELLTSYFKVEIGQKLLDHLQKWAVPQVLEAAAIRPTSESNEINVICEILNIIHLLPSGAVMFLDEMVRSVIGLELGVRRSIMSPFRAPLIKFMERFPTESVDYFLTSLSDITKVRLFADILTQPTCIEVRNTLAGRCEQLIEFGFNHDSSTPSTRVSAVLILYKLIKADPNALTGKSNVIDIIAVEWEVDSSKLVPIDANSDILLLSHRKRVAQILISYITSSSHSVSDMTLKLMSAFDHRSVINYSFIRDFILKQCEIRSHKEFMKPLLKKSLEILIDEDETPARKINMIKLLLIPSFVARFSKESLKSEFVNDLNHWNQSFIQKILTKEEENSVLRVEYLQLVALFVNHAPKTVESSRKEIIKYNWTFLRSEDTIGRLSAFVVLSLFIKHYDTPAKIVIQTFVSLLRAYHSEARTLARQALDILAPSLPERLPEPDASSSPSWVRWTRKILVDDGHLIPQLIAVWQMIIRQEELYYPYRQYFVQLIVASLGKLGMTPSSTTDTKALAIELCELVHKWESRRIEATEGREDTSNDMEIDEDNSSVGQKRKPKSGASPSKKPNLHEYVLTPNIKDVIINYLIRFLCMNAEPLHKRGRSWKTLNLVRKFFDFDSWKDVNVKIGFIEKFISSTEINENTVGQIIMVLHAIHTVCQHRSTPWFLDNISYFQLCVEKYIPLDDPKIVDPVCDTLNSFFKNVGDDLIATSAASLTSQLETLVLESLASSKNLYSMVSVVKAVSVSFSSLADRSLPILSKMLFKISKEFPTQTSTANAAHLQIYIVIVSKILYLMNERLQVLGESKKNFFNAFSLLIEKCPELSIQKSILEMLSDWVFTDKGTALTSKEKSVFLLKFGTLENKLPSDVFEQYLQLVLKIYEDIRLLHTDLTLRLEPVFLIGCRSTVPRLREAFVAIFSKNLPKTLFSRLSYVIGVQGWEPLSTSFWLKQCDEILLGLVNNDLAVNQKICGNVRVLPLGPILNSITVGKKTKSTHNSGIIEVVSATGQFCETLNAVTLQPFVKSLCYFLHVNTDLAQTIFSEIFTGYWKTFSNKERHDLNKYYVALMAKEHQLRQVELRPNVVSCLLETALKCEPGMLLPPQIVRYIGKHFNAWHTSLEVLQNQLLDTDSSLYKDYSKMLDTIQDSLAELYSDLGEDDAFTGISRRRCMYPETNAALSFEQIGEWQKAQSLYEAAQMKARNGMLPFSDAEYCLWEDRWITCAQKLQQWDLCNDLAKHDNNIPLQLECAWRITDWNIEKEGLQHAVGMISDSPNPRQKIFEAFLILSQLQDNSEKVTELQKSCDEGIQLALTKWHSLPENARAAQLPLLHTFQQFVELQEASSIYASNSNMPNRLQAIQELKGTLGTWRDRLPNFWEDINLWSQLVAWRQHVFSVINKNYQNFTDQNQGSVNTLAYRGYHEIAWIINRFAHVARKHHLYDVCNNSLSKIYTLPNIEIQDAFLKLREQAKCHLDVNKDLSSGLDVINTTNLGYFQSVQRAEFFAFKGIFLGKLGLENDAHQAFSAALQIDANLPKGWSAWAKFNDEQYQSTGNLNFAADAVNAYMHAAGLYKNYRSRKYIARVLWLLGCDSQEGKVAAGFELYRGDISLWYWLTFIPQLLNSLGSDTKHYKNVLIRIAKAHPQALYLPLRVLREEQRPQRQQAIDEGLAAPSPIIPSAKFKMDDMDIDESKDSDENMSQASFVKRKPWEHVEEIMTIVKTAYPLLALSIESMTDQMLTQLKATADEDIYRIIMAILSDLYQHLSKGLSSNSSEKSIVEAMKSTLEKCVNSPLIVSSKYHDELHKEFVASNYNLEQLIHKCRAWRFRLEESLRKRPNKRPLETISRYLVEFEHQKFDDVEVPGQYLQLRDNHSDFVRIDRIFPEIEYVKNAGIWTRRIVFLGHDGSKHCFSLQIPVARHSKREERVIQLFRQWNSILERRIETKRRGALFRVPTVVSLSPAARLIEDDLSNVSLQQVFEEHCSDVGLNVDAPVLKYIELHKASSALVGSNTNNIKTAKLEIFEEITKLVPDDILSKYMQRIYQHSTDLWVARQRFTAEYAVFNLISFIMNIGHRLPNKIIISRATGNVTNLDLLPLMNSSLQFSNPESVPFRLTPNIQKFMNIIGIEGQFVGSMINIAGALCEKESAIDAMLELVVREEVLAWKQLSHSNQQISDNDLMKLVKANCEIVKSRLRELACMTERQRQSTESTVPVCQPILDLISKSTNPQNLSEMEPLWMPWF